MDNFERTTLINIESKLDALIKSSENRITANEVTTKRQQIEIDNRIDKSTFTTCINGIKTNIKFIYSLVTISIGALLYSFLV